MTLTEAGAEIAPAIWQRVQARLDAIEARCGIAILHAVEAGSRAWGFPSPDVAVSNRLAPVIGDGPI